MVGIRDNLRLAADAIDTHKLRSVLTILGLTMGVATLITVMTLVQGANLYVEQKIANLGTNVFRLAKTPFAVVDFSVVVKALKNKNIEMGDYRAVSELCKACEEVGASASGTLSVQYRNKQTDDTTIIGYTPSMVDIDTRTLDLGRYFTAVEDRHAAYVCIIGASLVDQFFPNENPIGRTIRTGTLEFTVIGTFQKLGSVLGQNQDNFVIIPLTTYLKVRGSRSTPDARNQSFGRGGEFQCGAGRGTRDHALSPSRPARQRGQFLYRHVAKLHRTVAEHQWFVLRGLRDGELDLGGGGGDCHHECDAGQRNPADARDRSAARSGRDKAGHPAPVSCGKPAAMPDWRG